MSERTALWRRRQGDAPRSRGSVVTIGNFDGVHRGHVHMLERTVALARDRDLDAVVMSFEPMPREFFGGDHVPARLTTLTERHEALSGRGLDGHLCVRFDAALATLSPEAFVTRFVVGDLAARAVVVGHDFRFGHRRAGDIATLHSLGARHGFEVHEVPAQRHAGVRVSSTAVRQALAADDFARAEALLGRPYSMSGRVVPGERLGRTLGFATANLRPRRRVLPVHGVFAVRVCDGATLARHPAVASLGTRPTVGGRGHLLEVHLFDFQGNLYGRRLRVSFVAKLRDEAHFDSLEQMTEQMHRDAREARAALAL